MTIFIYYKDGAVHKISPGEGRKLGKNIGGLCDAICGVGRWSHYKITK